MKAVIHTLLNLLFVVLMLVSTTGVTVYRHYCSSEGLIVTSVFKDDAVCKHDLVKAEPACCHEVAVCTDVAKDHCCSNAVMHYRIPSKDYLFTQGPLVDIPVTFVADLWRETWSVDLQKYTTEESFNDTGPPLILTGKELLKRYASRRLGSDPLV